MVDPGLREGESLVTEDGRPAVKRRKVEDRNADELDGAGDYLAEQDTPVSPVPFPNRIYRRMKKSEVKSQLVFIRDSLKLIGDLYHHDNMSSTPWGAEETKDFLRIIDRQIHELSPCVSANQQPSQSLKTYYRRLGESILHTTEGSTASWKLLLMETKHHLNRLERLVININNNKAASRRHPGATHLH
ncbi:interferon phi 1 [Pholidichthys leucotaenia]